MADLVNITADGEVSGAGNKMFLRSVTLTPAAAVATLTVKTGGASGTALLTLQAAASGASVSWQAGGKGGVAFDGVYADIGGAGAAASFELEGI